MKTTVFAMNILENTFNSTMNPPSEDLLEICRICLSKVSSQDIDPIFESSYEGFSIADILKTIADITVDKELNMPNVVCKNCSRIIFDFHYVVKMFYKSEEYLKATLLNKEIDLIEKSDSGVEQLPNDDHNNDESLLFHNEDCTSIGSDHHDTSFHEDDNQLSANFEINNQYPLSETTKEEGNTETAPRESRSNSIEAKQEKLNDNQSDIQEVPTIKYSCEICGDCFLFKSGFGHHMLMVHNVCIQVNQYEQYSSQITIKVPKGVCDNEIKCVRKSNPPIPLYQTEVQCKKCKKTFSSIEALKEHNEVHKTFRCDQCGAAFIKNSYLRDHLLKHSSDKCYSCKDCGQAFKYRSALAIHRREHVGTNTGHMCETCGRNFKERGTLKTHIMLKHTNERKFPCSSCDLTFKLKAARDKHYLRKHTSNRTKDFVCSTCGMAYLNKETLTRHMAEKHTGTPSVHWCTVCQKSFTMKSNLSKHLRNKHNVITKKEQI